MPELPAELEWLINRTLEKDRALRYQTAADLKAALLALKRNSGSGEAAVPRQAQQANWIRPPAVSAESRIALDATNAALAAVRREPGGMIVTSWSAGGQKLIGVRKGIVTYSFATQQYERLTNSGYLPTWLNDNRQALFIAADELNLLDTATRQVPQILSVAPRLLQFISVAADSRFIVLSVNTTEADIWLLRLE